MGIRGEVRSRGTNITDKLSTGAIEVWVKSLEVFSKSDTPPFAIEDNIDTNDSLRLKYRYLDLRRPALQKIVSTFEQHPETEWVHGRCPIIDENDREVRRWINAYKHFRSRAWSLRLCPATDRREPSSQAGW